ncbi:hypothetical protein MBM_02429 [Drepanopeziza brunnea f. sp. 'multigermtubi' MB_m1]|uniref:Uncharacterized protein n=1 Tax=Marssonina brunnea f. sp. multigermtubi (strain MB_m1) TaxID=1072389 RepID=K1X2H2_MARBU|nr:uncharacterized protein MBM_02429 [Drepanopeziza brunnea f. sp. 'multigermtubi' MB_m1]EKD19192.1 hypothetical protein MBM_02429 [Drepanopeziza brunnea f. sp. 'multigermtubi' MB_m1]
MILFNAFAVTLTLMLSPAAVMAEVARNPLIKLCKDPAFVDCYEPPADYLKCVDVRTDFIDTITSLDTYDKVCYFYEDLSCLGARLGHTGKMPGLHVSEYTYLNDAISSFKCGIAEEVEVPKPRGG